jgi:hypothetical protein
MPRLDCRASTMSDLAMGTGVLIAVIAALASLIVALLNAVLTLRRDRWTKETERAQKLEDQEASNEAELDRMRKFLLTAALELAERINNIRNNEFLDFYVLSCDDAHRSKIARTTTFYCLARYWCIAEMVTENPGLHDLRGDNPMKAMATKLPDIRRTFASDKDIYGGRSFMVWREEQRAIGEKMRTSATPSGCIGYATFVERYDDVFAEWFASLNNHLGEPDAVRSPRLQIVQHELALVVERLDSDEDYDARRKQLLM